MKVIDTYVRLAHSKGLAVNNTTERQQRLRIKELHCVIRRWRAIALLLATVLAASILVIVLQLHKLP